VSLGVRPPKGNQELGRVARHPLIAGHICGLCERTDAARRLATGVTGGSVTGCPWRIPGRPPATAARLGGAAGAPAARPALWSASESFTDLARVVPSVRHNCSNSRSAVRVARADRPCRRRMAEAGNVKWSADVPQAPNPPPRCVFGRKSQDTRVVPSGRRPRPTKRALWAQERPPLSQGPSPTAARSLVDARPRGQALPSGGRHAALDMSVLPRASTFTRRPSSARRAEVLRVETARGERRRLSGPRRSAEETGARGR